MVRGQGFGRRGQWDGVGVWSPGPKAYGLLHQRQLAQQPPAVGLQIWFCIIRGARSDLQGGCPRVAHWANAWWACLQGLKHSPGGHCAASKRAGCECRGRVEACRALCACGVGQASALLDGGSTGGPHPPLGLQPANRPGQAPAPRSGTVLPAAKGGRAASRRALLRSPRACTAARPGARERDRAAAGLTACRQRSCRA